jgi:lipopolysaccharide transport protein LptA
MRRVLITISLLFLAGVSWSAPSPPAKASPAPSAKKPEKKAAEKPEKKAADNQDQSPLNKMMGDGKTPGSNEPTTTEIFSDEAFFDSAKSMGIFTGHVKVTDPRFNLQSEKLTVYISKGEDQGLERAVAEGNVGVVRDRPDPNGGPPTRAVGRGEIATYVAATGDVELKGTPRVQQGENTHIATSPDTIMIINQKGQLTTHGASRTEIRQQPKDDDTGDDGKAAAKGDDKTKDGAKKEGKKEAKGEKPTPTSKPSTKPTPKPTPKPSPKP